jgi:hypothetical protein
VARRIKFSSQPARASTPKRGDLKIGHYTRKRDALGHRKVAATTAREEGSFASLRMTIF